MIIETKVGAMTIVPAILAIPFVLLQVQAPQIDLFGIADKVGVIGILLYIAYTFSKKFDKLMEEFQKQLKEERDKSDAMQKELIDKIIKLSEKK